MTYFVSIKQSALKSLKNIAREDRLRIIEAIDQLKINPAAGGVLKGEYSGLRRIRIGSYRVVYEVHDEKLTVLVIRIGHRREIYRRI
jgi:mRNA interferase RelE/StbE